MSPELVAHDVVGVPSHFPSQAKLKVAQHVWLKSNIIVSGRMRITLNHFAETVIGDDDHDATTDRPASKLIVRIMGRQTDVRLRKHAFLDVGTKAYANRLEMDTGSKMQFMMPTSLMELKHVTVRGGGTIDGQGWRWWPLRAKGEYWHHCRPHLIRVHGSPSDPYDLSSSHLAFDNISLHNSPNFNFHVHAHHARWFRPHP
mgnify:CR=1 FL=1